MVVRLPARRSLDVLQSDHKKTPGIFSSLELLRYFAQNFLQEVLAEGPVPQREVDVILDIRTAGLVKDGGDRVIPDPT